MKQGTLPPTNIVDFVALIRLLIYSLRIGMLFLATSFPILVGTPIDGALLGAANTWYKAILFSAVSEENVASTYL